MGKLLLEIKNFCEKERIERYEYAGNCRKKWTISYVMIGMLLCKCVKFITRNNVLVIIRIDLF